jgi:hypothetical protein
MKKYIYVIKATFVASIIVCLATSCLKEVVDVDTEKPINSESSLPKLTNEDIGENELSKILLTIAGDDLMVNEMHAYVQKSLEYGLDEIAFLDEIINPEKYSYQIRSNSGLTSYLKNVFQSSSSQNANELTFTLHGLEIYWPYSEDWDRNSSPVITFSPSNEEDFERENVMAYKLISLNDESCRIDSLLVNEEYAMENPVWVIKNQSIETIDLINLKKNHDFTRYYPRDENLIESNSAHLRSTTSYKIAETAITSIKSEKQHDDWLNGGSEYVIYWFFPTKYFGLAKHWTSQIHFSRKEIKNKTIKNISFIGNYDWDKGQSHNRIKIIEFDPGKDINFNVKLSSTYKPDDSSQSVSGEFSTVIKINNQDDHIMEQTIPRTVMFTNLTKIDDNHYQKSFTDNGVTVNVKISGINGLEF